MRLIARVEWRSPEWIKSFKQRGIEARLNHRGMVVYLPQLDQSTFEVPQELRTIKLCINVSERGGLVASGKKASRVVCAPAGTTLRPYYLPRGGKLLVGGDQAWFSMMSNVVTVTAYSHTDLVIIAEHSVAYNTKTACIKSEVIWNDPVSSFIGHRCQSCRAMLPEPCSNPRDHVRPHDAKKCKRPEVVYECLGLPRNLRRFASAIIAVRQKTQCLDCRCVHFAR